MDDIADAVQALNKLNATIHLYAIIRRFHLVSLCHHRNVLLAETRVTRGGNAQESGRSETVAHRKLMSHAYPGLEPGRLKRGNVKDNYVKKSQALTHRLKIGQRWSMLAKAFAPGILALIPIRGDFQLSNSDYEKLPAPTIAILIDVLQRHRGGFLQEFSTCLDFFALANAENSLVRQDADTLKQEEYDSPRLVELCKSQP
ncbi:hypothetical protein EJ05DRAFT_268509 [Pseudovirgaria hyperparasitica]|uniref:Uncharacterized protein n=1 Tax=Pseudovirgaria hyperparasitica TaxID=470096 RepID=A0A6A6VSY2_9PEZI|nr:uncharacterized protein EJ05DRAFT_268509 [Pseudovirgaria hyperparasitica]KAF2752700.1 hypothetical protein EJ05DRAFT_268509 [Pseudovirgaria hyperparasitica]